MVAVGEGTYQLLPLDEGDVEIAPRTPRERYGAHILIGECKPVGKSLQGVEGRYHRDYGVGKFALKRSGKSEKEGISRSEDYRLPSVVAIFGEHIRERHRYVGPYRLAGKDVAHQLVVATSAREISASLHGLRRLG